MKAAGYCRYSHAEQSAGFSLAAQKRIIEKFVIAQGGEIVEWYCDEAETGTKTKNRDEFLRMRQDARKKKWDTLVVAKLDRLSRSRMDARAVKILLRHDFGIKVLSATEPTEDSGDKVKGALIEGILESLGEWYSNNLSEELRKGKREKSIQGFHNDSIPPFGYVRQGRELIPAPDEYPGVILAFTEYAVGDKSYTDIVRLLNTHGYRNKSGRPFAKDAVCELLQNVTYTGKVKYQPTTYTSEGKRVYTAPIEIYDGRHQAIIGMELFERCQTVRAGRTRGREGVSHAKYPYLLRGLIACYRCTFERTDKFFPSVGKMVCHTKTYTGRSYYRCAGRWSGLDCLQDGIPTKTIDDQVIAVLKNLNLPAEWKAQIIEELAGNLGEKHLQKRLRELATTIERLDFRWDEGFITDKQEFIDKRKQLQEELNSLTPFGEDNTLDIAADILENFSTHLRSHENDIDKQHELIRYVVEQVYVYDREVVALSLKANYYIILNSVLASKLIMYAEKKNAGIGYASIG